MTAKDLRTAIDKVKAKIEPLIEKRDKLQLKLAILQRECSHASAIQTGRATGFSTFRPGQLYRFKCPECLQEFVK